MTPNLLQDILIKELDALFAGYKLKDKDDNLVPINIYPQSLPAKGISQQIPFIVVKLQGGEDSSVESPNTCKILFMIAVHDKEDSYQGHKDVLSIIDKIYHHFFTKVIFDDKYQIVRPFEWDIPDEDTYPYYYGSIESNWEYPKVTPIPENFL